MRHDGLLLINYHPPTALFKGEMYNWDWDKEGLGLWWKNFRSKSNW